MQIIPYLFFNGTCAQAMETYAAILGGKVTASMPAAAAPPEAGIPEDRRGWIMHSELTVGERHIFASDNVMGDNPPMSGASVMLGPKTAAEARRIFDALAEGGTVTMSFGPTFWSAGFGGVTDRFGTRWIIGAEEAPAQP